MNRRRFLAALLGGVAALGAGGLAARRPGAGGWSTSAPVDLRVGVDLAGADGDFTCTTVTWPASTVRWPAGAPVRARELTAGQVYEFVYDTGGWRLVPAERDIYDRTGQPLAPVPHDPKPLGSLWKSVLWEKIT